MTQQTPSEVAPQNPPVAPVEESKPDTVTREAYEKAVEREKKLKEQLRAFEADKAEREKKELEARGEYQKIAEMAKKEAEDLRAKLAENDRRQVAAKKFSAVLKGLGTQVEEKWFDVIGNYIDDVAVDPDSGAVVDMSVTKVVDKLKQSWPEMLRKPAPGMPAGAPMGANTAFITRQEWLKLSAAEMKKWKMEQIKD